MINIASVVSAIDSFDTQMNGKQKEHVVVGRNDKKIAVVDEYGKVSGIGVGSKISARTDGTGSQGTITIPDINNPYPIIIKWGKDTLNANFSGAKTFIEPFPNACHMMIGSQVSNDPITSLMIAPVSKTDYNVSFTGGANSEQISWIAIGN